jgi:RNA polymerase sigma factor (sigma-70 family)
MILLAAAARGDRLAADRLLRHYDPYLRAFVLKHFDRLRFQREGEDILQAIRLEVFQSLPRIRCRERGKFHAFLKRVILRKLMKWKKRRPHPRNFRTGEDLSLSANGLSPSQEVMQKEQRERILAAVEDVPARYREVLRFVIGLQPSRPSPVQLGAFLQKPPEAARKFTARALRHLRQALA